MAKWTTSYPNKPGWYWVRGDARGAGGSEPFLRAANLYKMNFGTPGDKPDTIYLDGDNYQAKDAPFGGVYVAFYDEPIQMPTSFENEYEDGKWDVLRGDRGTDASFLGQVDAPTYYAAYDEAKKRWPNHELIIRQLRKKEGKSIDPVV